MTVFLDPPPLPRWLEPALPFRRRAARVDGTRVHFIDEGEGQAVLLFHGNPTWCYLWRKVIPHLRERGLRVVAPDLVGLGLSDKPRSVRAHTLEMHLRLMAGLLEALDLGEVVVVGQDWGGPIGLGSVLRGGLPVRGIVLANTAVARPRRPLHTHAFHRFAHAPLVSDIVFRLLGFPLPLLAAAQGDRHSIGRAQRRAYRWPLRHLVDRAAPLGLARMVPDSEDHPSMPAIEEIGNWLAEYRGPAALVWGTRDPILGRALRRHRDTLPQARVIETRAGHFLQEEVPSVLAAAIAKVAGAAPAARSA